MPRYVTDMFSLSYEYFPQVARNTEKLLQLGVVAGAAILSGPARPLAVFGAALVAGYNMLTEV